VEPLSDAGLLHLFQRIRQYRLLFTVYVLSAFLYSAGALALSLGRAAVAPPVADGALLLGFVGSAACFAAYWALLGPGAFRSRAPADVGKAADHIFFSMLFLLAMGECPGLLALTAAACGAGPPWKLGLLCLWQVVLCGLVTPDRDQWDRLLSRWENACK
jgi:hypothetical protein